MSNEDLTEEGGTVGGLVITLYLSIGLMFLSLGVSLLILPFVTDGLLPTIGSGILLILYYIIGALVHLLSMYILGMVLWGWFAVSRNQLETKEQFKGMVFLNSFIYAIISGDESKIIEPSDE